MGERPPFDFEPKDHLDLGVELDVIDMESAGPVSGSRFAYLKRELVLVELALVQFAIQKLASQGFTPVVPPVLVREDALFWTGFLPTDRAQIYEIAGDDLFLVGTSEVSLAALHADEILAEEDLPLRYAGFSTCFRREAGAAGKDTRGIFRVHQFDKVEMFSFVHPDSSAEEHDRILAIQEEIFGELGIPYRVVNIAAGDLGASAAKKYDLRGVASRAGPLPRDHVLLEHDRLPGPPPAQPLPARGRRVAAAGAHAQRYGRRGRAHPRGDHGELPAQRRQHRDPEGAAFARCPGRDSSGCGVRRAPVMSRVA